MAADLAAQLASIGGEPFVDIRLVPAPPLTFNPEANRETSIRFVEEVPPDAIAIKTSWLAWMWKKVRG